MGGKDETEEKTDWKQLLRKESFLSLHLFMSKTVWGGDLYKKHKMFSPPKKEQHPQS